MGRAHLTAVAPQLQRYNQVGRYPKHPQSHLPLSHTCHRLKLDLEEKNASNFAFLKLPLQCSPFGYLAPKERFHLQLDLSWESTLPSSHRVQPVPSGSLDGQLSLTTMFSQKERINMRGTVCYFSSCLMLYKRMCTQKHVHTPQAPRCSF